MKLSEHPDFDQAILQAADHFTPRGLRPALIEKDYYVTASLRIIAAGWQGRAIFKGGTSLSKGWSLIDRFSEDIDLFLDPQAFPSALGKNAIDRELKKIRDAIAVGVPMQFLKDESSTIGGFGRSDRFSYPTKFAGVGEVAPKVLLEAGIASGRQPTADVPLNSYLAQFLIETGNTLGANDEQPFTMRLLHYRRTFVEKLFAIHKKVELFKRDGTPVGSHARHFYDLYQLAGQSEVQAMLQTPEYGAIKQDYDRVSREFFPAHYFQPDDMRFANSDAIFPSGDLEPMLAKLYEEQCGLLCYGPYPAWVEVRERFARLRDVL
jgi:hypothetical protein